ncbi:Aaa-atpase [Thalictrum thalictroides]|uniref:Aaa-atpase n=1 Tax=Thalictrum thalictroides TaxID=46969 RepID=A0A7J6V4X6_THATH|nr:Aaa-atpase [Thalictrum thalictroides]
MIDNGKDYMISVDKTEGIEIVDVFQGIRFKWRFLTKGNGTRSYSYAPTRTSMNSDSDRRSEGQYLELTFYKKYKEKVLNSYFPCIMNATKAIKKDNKIVKLYTMSKDSYSSGPWSSINLDHPATFEKLAMDNMQKMKIIDDLDRFVKRKEFYRCREGLETRISVVWSMDHLVVTPMS